MSTGPTDNGPRTFVVGAGPVAIALAGALRSGGIPVLGLWARRAEAARQAGDIAGVRAFSGAFPQLVGEADAIILAVRDEAIDEVARGILANEVLASRILATQSVFIHCSGARPAARALAPVVQHHGRAGVATLHPLRALADGAQGMAALPGTVFGIEGDGRGVAVARALAVAMGGVPLLLASEQMASYHAAASMASNFLVALLDAASSVLAASGMDTGEALRALLPLARGSLDNIAERGVRAGLTGPIQRGDVATVERHLESLRDQPDLLALYTVMARHTLRIARGPGDGAERRAHLDSIERLL